MLHLLLGDYKDEEEVSFTFYTILGVILMREMKKNPVNKKSRMGAHLSKVQGK
jgi:hypothetical protein